jgi:hypothetical protein
MTTNWIEPYSKPEIEMSTNVFNDDFKDFITAFNKANVEYVLVGGYSVIIHGYSRTTGDLDIFVNCTSTNYTKIVKAFDIFKMPLFGMTEDRFLNLQDFEVFEYGRPPIQIDIITNLKGLSFDEVFASSTYYHMDNDVKVRVIHINELIRAKIASGRPKDINDIENLKK